MIHASGGMATSFADRSDDATGHYDSGVFHRRPGYRNDFGAANGEVLRLATLRERLRRSSEHLKCKQRGQHRAI